MTTKVAERAETSFSDIYLGCVENDAAQLAHYAGELDRHAAFIVTMPAFRTRGEALLDDAESKLKSALEAVRKARRQMRPVRLQKAG